MLRSLHTGDCKIADEAIHGMQYAQVTPKSDDQPWNMFGSGGQKLESLDVAFDVASSFHACLGCLRLGLSEFLQT